MVVDFDELNRQIEYNGENGEFTNKIKRSSNALKGCSSGTVSSRGYLRISFNGKQHQAHRLAWLFITGEMPSSGIDHIDGNGLNNSKSNLRLADQSVNLKNKSIDRSSKTGVHGVGFYTPRGKYRARCMVDKKEIHLGYFDDLFEAICARKSANNKYGFHKNHGRVAV